MTNKENITYSKKKLNFSFLKNHKLTFLTLCVICILIKNTNAQTTYVVAAAGGTHTTIASAYAACGIAGITYIIEIRTTGGTPYANAEAKPIVLATKPALSITIRPEAGSSLTMTTAAAASIFSFTGGDNITIDGRAGGVGTTPALTIENTAVAVSKYALQFSGGSLNNTIKYCIVKGSNTSTAANATSGVIVFGAGTNNGNTIDNCTIQPSSGNKPAVGIMGFDATTNNILTITNNNFVDISMTSVWASTSQSGWTITGNSFYQSAAFTPTAHVYIISIDNGGGYTVSNNYIGGRAPQCAGAAYALNSSAFLCVAINFGGSVAGADITVNNNIIQNMNCTSTNTGAGQSNFKGIFLQGSCNYTVGISGAGNLIGSTTLNSSMVVTNNAASGANCFSGISSATSGNVSIAYNTIAGITTGGSLAGSAVYCIKNSAGNVTVDNNLIGSTTSANSISVTSNLLIHAIDNIGTNGITVTNNTFQNFSHSAATNALEVVVNTAGPLICTNNTIKNITTSAATAHNIIDHSGSTANISSNIIQDISLTGATGTVNIINTASASAVTINSNTIGSATANNIAISCNSNYSNGINTTSTGTVSCTGNTIQNVLMSSAGTSPCFQGISHASSGALTFTSNTINNVTCNSTGGGNAIIGIYVNSASTAHILRSNTVSNLVAAGTTNVAGYVTGIRISNGGGLLSKNLITGLQLSFTNVAAEIDGMDITTGAWDAFDNVVLLSNGAVTNSIVMVGMYFRSGTNSRAFYNTIKLSGSVASGVATTAGLYVNNTNTKTIQNNIIQNLRTGTGTHYATRMGNTTTATIGKNYVEVANNQSQVCFYTSANTFAAWNTNVGNTELNGTITLDALGLVTTDPFVGAGTALDLTATVSDDINGVTRSIASWMGAYEGPDITVTAFGPGTYCAGTNTSIAYTAGGNAAFNSGNVFTAQLSNSAGSFATPTNIGTTTNTTSGSIVCTWPSGLAYGTGYLVRIISSNPVVTGSNNLTGITLIDMANSAPTAIAASGVTYTSFTANWASISYANGYYLDVATDAGFTSMVGIFNNYYVGAVTTYSITGLTAGTTYYYRVRASNPSCGVSPSSNTITQATTAPTTFVVATLGGTHTTIQAAYNACVTAGGYYTIEVRTTGGTPYTYATEAKPIVCAANVAASITIRPETGSNVSLSGGTAASIFNFTGGDNVTIDGRAGGVGSTRAFTIENTSAVTTKFAMQFSGGSTNNTFKYTIFKGSNPINTIGTTTGVILFASGGNNNNIIEHCVIRESGASKPAVGIMGFDATTNNLLIIRNNEFINITNKWVYATTGQSDWVIINNHFYQTAAYAPALSNNGFICFESGSGYIITGNYMGGQSTFCGGAPFTFSSNSQIWSPIRFNGSSAGATIVIDSNTIANISHTYTGTSGNSLFSAIKTAGVAAFDIGTTYGNTFGSQTSTGNIILTVNSASAAVGYRILNNNTTGNVNFSKNKIGGITLNGTRNSATTYMIYNSGAGSLNCSNNTIGGTVSNSLLISSDSELDVFFSDVSGSLTLNNNTIQNITHSATTAPFAVVNNTFGALDCQNNIFTDISSANSDSLTIIFHQPTDNAAATISNNVIQNITFSNTTATPIFSGISIKTSGVVICDSNTIGGTAANNMSMANGNGVYGIYKSFVSTSNNITNNTIQNFNLTHTSSIFKGIFNSVGAVTCTTNVIKNITAAGNNINRMIDHAGTTATISSNIIQDIILSGATSVFSGINLNSTSAVNVSSNIIGSATANNISLAGNSTSFGIFNGGTGSFTCAGNTVQNFNATNAGTSNVFYGIANASGAGVISASNNTIQNITSASTNTTFALAGIYNGTTTSGQIIRANTVTGLALSNSGAGGHKLAGVYCSAGAGAITKNIISVLDAAGTADIVYGTSTNGAWDLFNNVILLGGANAAEVRGIDFTSSASNNVRIYHNTVKVYGSCSDASTSFAIGTTTSSINYLKTINNNICLSNRTGSGTQYAIYGGDNISFSSNYNYLEATNNPTTICYYAGVGNRTFAQWKTSGGGTNDVTGTITLNALGVVTTSSFPGAGTGTNLIATVPDDILGVTRSATPWMGAYENAAITTTYTSGSGTYTVPSCASSITIECWGAGGGGGGGSILSLTNAAGGGGGGAYSSLTLSVTPGNTYSYAVGAGGAGSTGTAAGGNGGDTYFNNTATVLAKGGTGGSTGANGAGGAGGSSAAGVGSTKYAGGNGRTGVNGSYSGGGGSSAGNLAAGVNATNQNGAIAPALGANGGNGTVTAGNNGSNGANYGGGGGGARSSLLVSGDGGNGTNGKIVISYYNDPAIGNNIVSTNQTLCSGTTAAMLTGTAPTGGNGTYTYQWQSSTDGGTTWNNIAGATASNYSPGVPTVSMMYQRIVSSNGCTISTSNSITITVNPTPIASAGPDVIKCPGSAVAIGGAPTGSGAGSPFTYSWSPAGSLSSTNTANPTSTTATTTTYTVVVTNSFACTNSAFMTVSIPTNGGAGTWTWLGLTTDWFDACNWDKKCLPDALSDVSIPGATANNPIITGATGNCKTININTTTGGHLNIVTTSSGKLIVAQ